MQTRGEFLATGVVAALAPSSPEATPKPEPSFPPLDFTLAAFDASLNVPAPHKHLFASTKIDGGLVLGQVRGVGDAYDRVGISANDYHPVAVLYHGVSIDLAFDDSIWNDYFIPLQPKGNKDLSEYAKDFATVYNSNTRGNPSLHKTGEKDDSSIEELVAAYGARFYVCNEATKGISRFIARQKKLDPVAVYARLAAHLVPNAMLVPAGIWAVHAVQERRYTYLQATL